MKTGPARNLRNSCHPGSCRRSEMEASVHSMAESTPGSARVHLVANSHRSISPPASHRVNQIYTVAQKLSKTYPTLRSPALWQFCTICNGCWHAWVGLKSLRWKLRNGCVRDGSCVAPKPVCAAQLHKVLSKIFTLPMRSKRNLM